MTKATIALLALTGLFFGSCTKDYTCSCVNPGGVYKTYHIKGSKKSARAKCAEYSADEQNMPFSESACSL